MTANRVHVLHGVNLDQLGRRPAEHYPQVTLDELEVRIGRFARDLGLEVTFDQTNHEGEFCERLHEASAITDALILNPGAWTHYSYAIRDALEIAGLPAVEVHLSDVDTREAWRQVSVLGDLCFARVAGRGVDGYREALELIAAKLGEGR
jgi:3-dehydroquinate dehydratase-2